MAVHKATFIQDTFASSQEWTRVLEIANDLYGYLSNPKVAQEIDEVNVPGASSKEIQNVLLRKAEIIGFRDESKGLFRDYPNNQLRPDFYMPIGETGIIIEVERGKTNQNNMDFLDFWKCHICSVAHYLFLFVPYILVQNSTGRIAGKPYDKVVEHMSPFFQRKNYTNVRGLVVISY